MSLLAFILLGFAAFFLSAEYNGAFTPSEEIPLEFGSLPARRPTRSGFVDLVQFFFCICLVIIVNLFIVQQLRTMWNQMEAVRIVLEELEKKITTEEFKKGKGKGADELKIELSSLLEELKDPTIRT